MPWCTECQSEYREGITTCPTCNVALSATPPEPPDEIDDEALLDSDKELVVIVRAQFKTCLEIREALRGKGIPCVLLREADEGESAREHREALIDVLVEETRIEEASQALHEKWSGLLQKEGLEPATGPTGEAEPMELHCPACNAVVAEEATECPDCGLALGG